MNIVKEHRGISRLIVGLTCVVAMILSGLSTAWSQTASAAAIQFLSPTSFGGEAPTLTDNDSGVNGTYRLSAWTANAPQGALVEFELLPGDAITKAITIGSGTAVASDTFEYQWDIAEGPTGVVEGPHTLKVALYDADSNEVAADTMPVNILHGTAEQKGMGEISIDLTYPVSGGPLGYYTSSNGKSNSVLDPKIGAKEVTKAFFTTSAPGTAPVWNTCNAREADDKWDDGIRCTYPVDDPSTKDGDEGIDPTKVTAVAIAISREDGSADVARVVPYLQEPSAMRFDMYGQKATGVIDVDVPGSSVKQKDDTGRFPCSDWLRLKVTDQAGRPIAAANVDAHATGPSDQLKFHTSYLSTLQSPHLQAPEEGHSLPEQGAKCLTHHDTNVPQGEHSLAGKADNKHVETTAGTTDGGTFDLRLQTDQPGVTNLTVWTDNKNDDRFCSGEPSFATTLSWGTEQQTGSAEQPVTCDVLPGTADPFDGSRTAGIETSASSVLKGQKARIVGSIDAAEDVCEIGQSLKLKAKRPSAARFRTVATGTTDAFGLTSFKVTVKRTKIYRVVAPAAGNCERARSAKRTIRAL